MSLAKFNRKGLFDYDPTNVPYVTLKQLFEQYGKEQKYQIQAMWVHNSKEYGASPVFALDDVLVNIPKHLTDSVNEMLKDETAIQDIKEGKGYFTIYEYESHNKKCYSINYVD